MPSHIIDDDDDGMQTKGQLMQVIKVCFMPEPPLYQKKIFLCAHQKSSERVGTRVKEDLGLRLEKKRGGGGDDVRYANQHMLCFLRALT